VIIKQAGFITGFLSRKKILTLYFQEHPKPVAQLWTNYLENELSAITGQKIKVANLGYCRRGRDIQFVMLKDLFQQKKPKILVIEVAEDEPKKSHPVFPYLAESNDLWGSFVFFNQRYFLNIWKGIVVRFEYLKHRLFRIKV
jgi:hypothetical protein